MVLAAGLGTRLRPLTYEITKPMVPVLDRPVMAHILDLLDRHGFERDDRQPALLPGLDPRVLRRAPDLSLRAGAARHRGRRARVRGVLRRRGVSRDLRRRAHRHRPHARSRRATASRAGSRRWRSRRCPTRASTASCCTTARGGSRAFRRSPRPRRRCRTSATAASTCSTPRIFDYFPERPFVRLGAGRVPGAARERRAVPHPRGARVLERRRLAERAAPGHVRRAARRAAPGGRGRGGRPGRGRRRRARRCPRTPRSKGRRGSAATCRSAQACA